MTGTRAVHHHASLSQFWCLGATVLLALCAGACSMRKDTGYMRSFTQSGTETLVEVTDRDGSSWKLLSVDAQSVKTYHVVNSQNQVALAASAFIDKVGTEHAVVFADTTEKEEAMAVL